MTTKAAAAAYEAAHVLEHQHRGWAIYNPHGKPVSELPVIYGWNNGGEEGWMSACLIAQDGTSLGGHICSSEGYMPADLGILEGTRPDRHEEFKAHYPDGYRMEFVGYEEAWAKSNAGLVAAWALNTAKRAQKAEVKP
jgi:hypothetical protein